ncbi:MAG: PDZ domain-containing protein [Clostridia bacterium]|nr:PDZ domain-containing protein [Clostridia bacterium]
MGKRISRNVLRPATAALVLALLFIFAICSFAEAAYNNQLLQEVRSIIRSYYYHPVSEWILYSSGDVEQLIEVLGDPYTQYFSPEEYREFMDDTNGSYGGVGMELGVKDGAVVIISVFKGSPAEAVGLKPGDIITAVNGISTYGKSIDSVAGMVRGEPGTKVTLTVLREDTGFNVTLTRRNIVLETVEYELLDSGVGYIRITTFSSDVGEKTEKALRELKAQGARGIILDLRNNPGGYLTSALEVAELFLPQGRTITYVRNSSETVRVWAKRPLVNTLPLVVLVDHGSASASEIVAAAVKENHAGILVGTTTFGKGTVQTVMPLDSEPGAVLKITTGEYLSSMGRRIDGIGVSPHYVIMDPELQLKAAEAILLSRGQGSRTYGSSLIVLPDVGATYLNGRLVAYGGGIFISQGNIMVPARLIAEAFGGTMNWDPQKKEAVLGLGGQKIYMELRKGTVRIEGVDAKEIKPAVGPRIVNGRVFIPLRLLSHVQGFSVHWDAGSRRGVITWQQ